MKIFFKSILVIISIILLTGCSKKENPVIQETISLVETDYTVGGAVKVYLAIDQSLTFDKEEYHLGDLVKINFKIKSEYSSGDYYLSKIIFTNKEKFAIEIYKDSLLINKYPLQLTESEPDTVSLPIDFSYSWNQKDNGLNQVEEGTYLVKAHLIHDGYSEQVEEKELTILK